jgi:hypothetical protein
MVIPSPSTSWITVDFVPTTTPFFAHQANPSGTPSTLAEPVAGWLIQNKYRDEQMVPVDSRVVAGVLSEGQVFAAAGLTMFIGVYPKGEEPGPRLI